MSYKDLFEFGIGDIVYLKTDSEQNKRIVTAIKIIQGGVLFGLSCSTNETYHYAIEIASEIDVLTKIEG